jgi:uncharacterized protein YbaP (TraB family)
MRMMLRVLVFLLPLSALAGTAGDKRFLWKVSSGSAHVWMLGSIHAAKKEIYPLPAEIEKAFAASKILVVEADQNKVDPAKLQQMIFERGLYKPGESLSTKLPAEGAKKALELAAKIGLPAAQAERMKPWFLALNVSMAKIQALGYDPKLGIDHHFMEAARAKDKPIQELESTQFQLDLLAGFSDDLQILFVTSTLEDLDRIEEDMKKMFAAWTRGDVDALETLVLKEGMAKRPEMAPLRMKLFDDRNVAMAEKVAGYLKTGEVHFVIMGAGHLLGEKGVVELLRKKGFKVEQIES